MERIVLGFDGSPAAESALEWVAHRAAAGPVGVDVVGVVNMFGGDRVVMADRLAHARARLDALRPGLVVRTAGLDGTMPGTLLESAGPTDLVVMGIVRGHPVRAALEAWMPVRAAARARTAVCFVPAGWQARTGPVAVGLDADSSDGAIAFGAAEAARAGAALVLVHVGADAELLERARMRVAASHPDLAVSTALVGDVVDPVEGLRRATEEGALVVLGTHHRGVLSGGLLGSVTQAALWELRPPVCVAPPPAPESQA